MIKNNCDFGRPHIKTGSELSGSIVEKPATMAEPKKTAFNVTGDEDGW